MKKTIVLALMAMAIVAVPATAQTRKEKKAAEKAQWEQAQQFAAEEAALRHQMKMDSLANAQKVAEEQRRAAEAQAAADKAAAEAKAKAEAEEKELREHSKRCFDCPYTEDFEDGFVDVNVLVSENPNYCNKAKLESGDYGISCENSYYHWDEATFKIEEVEVEE